MVAPAASTHFVHMVPIVMIVALVSPYTSQQRLQVVYRPRHLDHQELLHHRRDRRAVAAARAVVAPQC